MWPRWARIPLEDFTEVTLVIEDIDDPDKPDDPDDPDYHNESIWWKELVLS